MKKTVAALTLCCACATACGEPSAPSAPPPTFSITTAAGCASTDSLRALLRQVFRFQNDRAAADSRLTQIIRRLGAVPPGPDTADARAKALALIDFTLQKYRDNRLIGGTSPATQAIVAIFVNELLCTVGLPGTLTAGALSDEGAVAIISPTTDTAIVTGTGFAGVDVDPGTVGTPTLVTITRLPDTSPLLTPFDQYPLYFEFSASPAPSFTNPVTVGVCLASSIAPPDPSRLRLAHAIAPYTSGAIEVLPLAPTPFLDCTNADIAARPITGPMDLASAGGRWLLREVGRAVAPRPLMAAVRFASGLGGTVRTFSPFAAIDTLGIADAATWTVQSGHAFQPAPFPPGVNLFTPTNQKMAGIPINFVVTLGGGSVSPGTVVTDANGIALTTSWMFGPVGPQRVVATPVVPAGTGIARSPKIFNANAF